ncbi:MAG TPA: TonB-dependent receptor [Aeromonadales bacterium]|nr:TonB-dependent receptor [Aeromonadales bacterium]
MSVISAPGWAASDETNNDDEDTQVIIVTANKSNETVQEVPLAITALTGEFISKVNLTDVKDLVSYTPGVSGNSQDSFIDAISFRGVRTQDFGVGGDPSIGFFKNDLYEGRNGSAVSTLYDVDRAEMLRGPQGFLFGRNSIGGAISVYTTRAQLNDSEGYAELDLGERGHVTANGAVNIPVSDNFAMRFAGYYSTENGFAKNFATNTKLIEHDIKALRWSTTYEEDKLLINTMVEYEDRKLSGSVYRAIDTGDVWDAFDAAFGGVQLRGGPHDIDSDQSQGEGDKSKILTTGLHIEYDLGFAKLTSNTGYKDHDYYYSEDYDGTPLQINTYQQDQTGNYFQQELRLNSKGDGPLSWYVGASYYKEKINTKFAFIAAEDAMCQYYGYAYNSGMTFSGCQDLYAYYGSSFTPSADGLLRETSDVHGNYSGWSSYADLNYALTEKLEVELGLRYTSDTKKMTNFVPTPNSDLGAYWAYGFSTAEPIRGKKSWNNTSFRFLTRYRPVDDMMLYASYTQGYKSGGFGTFNLDNNAAGDPAVGNTEITNADGFPLNVFGPENIDSYEIGYKDTWFEFAKVDLTAFTYNYTGLQVIVADGGASIVKNVGNVDAWGLEGTLRAPLNDNFDVELSMGYLDTEATKLQAICDLADVNGCEGRRLFWAPKFTGSLVISGEFELEGDAVLTTSLAVSAESERGGGFTNLSETKIPAYQEVSFRIGYQTYKWSVEAYVDNLTNEFTWDGENNGTGILPAQFFGPKRPRTFGIHLKTTWD